MGSIFISHSSRDNAAAAEMRARLNEFGHNSLFLDFDPSDGIPAGRSWEEELYAKLRGCRAVVVLCSPASMASDWCFAEITHAKSMGKHVFPVIIADCEMRPVLSSAQRIDLRTDTEDAYARLNRGLVIAGLDPTDMFQWDGKRPLYPGLMAFQEEDASVYFGRDGEIQEGLDLLKRLGDFGGPRQVMILGASGSGKSSLARAGFVPRLKRDPSRWIVIDTFRPFGDPMREMCRALASAFAKIEGAADTRTLLDLTMNAGTPDENAARLLDVAENLRIATGQREAKILMIVDQFEELLGYRPGDPRYEYLAMLRSALEAPNSPIIAIGTLRSDFLGQFQNEPAMRDLTFESLPIGPLSSEGFAQVIEGPAALGGVELGSGLVQAVIKDTGANDALPLLAFTLRELYERYGDDNLLELQEYDDLGRLEGSVARAAEGVMAATTLSASEMDDLRTAFVSMVRINEQGQYSRRVAKWGDMPQRVHPTLERFVDARLLVSQSDGRDRIVEVAHEALFRSWRQLRQWLDSDRDNIRLRDSIHEAATEWDHAGREAQLLVHKAGRLEAAEALLRTPRFEFEPTALSYIEACVADREAARERAVRREKAKRRRLQWTIAGLLVGLLGVGGAGVWAMQQQQIAEAALRQAEAERSLALQSEARVLVAQSRDAAGRNDFATAAELALAALPSSMAEPDRPYLAEAEIALYNAAVTLPLDGGVHVLAGHADRVTFAAYSADGSMIVTASHDGTARIWEAATKREIQSVGTGQARIMHAAFSPDNRLIATAGWDGTTQVWDVLGGNIVMPIDVDGSFYVAFSPDGTRLAATSFDGTAFYDMVNRSLIAKVQHQNSYSTHAVFSPDSRMVLTSNRFEGGPTIWDASTGAMIRNLQGHEAGLYSVAFDPGSSHVLTASADNTARIWDIATGDELVVLDGHTDKVFSAEFSPDGQWVVTASKDGTARLWSPWQAAAPPIILDAHAGEVRHAAFSPDSRQVVTASRDDTAMIWDLDGNLLATLSGHEADVTHAVFSPDGQSILTTGDQTARIWQRRLAGSVKSFHGHPAEVRTVAFKPDGKTIASAGGGYVGGVRYAGPTRLWSVETGQHLATLAKEDYDIAELDISPDGNLLMAITWLGNRTLLWDLGSRQVLAHWDGYGAFSPDGLYVAAANQGQVFLFETDTLREVVRFVGHSAPIRRLAFSEDSKRLLTVSNDQTARLWEVPGGQLLSVLGPHDGWVATAAISPDTKTVVTIEEQSRETANGLRLMSRDYVARVWDADTGVLITQFAHHDDMINQVVFSPDGRLVATASGYDTESYKTDRSTSRDDRVLLWDPATGDVIQELKGHTRPVVQIAFSPDGTRLASASEDLTARIWDVASGKTIAILPHKSHVQDIVFSPDGMSVATGSGGSDMEPEYFETTTRIWPLFDDTQALIDFARANVEQVRGQERPVR
ncbi:MAG: TIR domain-containing protein [Pseudomonadota bacterium]